MGVYHDFLLKSFSLTVPRKILGEPFCVRKIVVSENIKDMRGDGYHDFLSRLFCLTVPKVCSGTLPGFGSILVLEPFLHEKWAVSQFSVVKSMLTNISKGWDSNSYLPFQNLVVLPTLLCDPLETLTNVSGITKLFGTAETRTRTCRFRTLLS